MKTLKITIFFSLLLLLLLPTRVIVAFGDLNEPRLGVLIIDADTNEGLDIGTKNILVTVDIPTEIFEEEKETLKVDLRVVRDKEIFFVQEDQDIKDKFEDVENERTKTAYLFSLDNPLEKKDRVEMCFSLIPSRRGGCSAQMITKDTASNNKDKKPFNNQVEGGDIAENMVGLASENLEPGDLVASFDKDNRTKRVIVAKTSKSYQKELIGIVSTAPGVVLEDNLEDQISYPIAPIALIGTVETKVSDQNGPISIGDMITSSNTPGIGMRATGFGPVVGKALEPLESGSGKIKVLISLGWYQGSLEQGGGLVLEGNQDGILSQEDLLDITTGDPNMLSNANGDAGTSGGSVFGNMMTLNAYGDIVFSSGIVVTNPSYLGKLTMMGDLNLNGHQITNIGGLAGKDNKWMIDENGNFITSGLIAQVVDTSEGQKTMYAMASPEPEYTISGHGQLSGGGALIEFESWFSEVISSDVELKVVVTPTNSCNGLYITSKAPLGFIVRELNNGTSNAQFDWIAIARKKGYESLESVWKIDGDGWHIVEEMSNDQNPNDQSNPNDQMSNDQTEQGVGDGEQEAGDEEGQEATDDEQIDETSGDQSTSEDTNPDNTDQSQDNTEATDDADSTADEQEDSNGEEIQEESGGSDTETQETEEGTGDDDTDGSQSSEDEQTN